MRDQALARLRAWPIGTNTGRSGGRRYSVSKSVFAGGRSVKLVATELGGRDYISLNLYDLSGGARLFPCEMPVAKVVAFLADLVED
ncbi:hypothetical protein [Ruegeria aquimaris]|uniref:hypothetical protein n=1 Tax=Ruegeria aquimaris TaxID=2984333 RepID=UPI003850445B